MGGDLQAALDRHGEAVATVRAFSQRSRAARVVLLVDAGDGSTAAMIDCTAGGDIELTEGERAWGVPADTPIPALPRPFPELRPPPPTAVQVDPDTGELEAPLGAVANLGAAVLGLAA